MLQTREWECITIQNLHYCDKERNTKSSIAMQDFCPEPLLGKLSCFSMVCVKSRGRASNNQKKWSSIQEIVSWRLLFTGSDKWMLNTPIHHIYTIPWACKCPSDPLLTVVMHWHLFYLPFNQGSFTTKIHFQLLRKVCHIANDVQNACLCGEPVSI